MRLRPLSGFGVVLFALSAWSSSDCGGRTALEDQSPLDASGGRDAGAQARPSDASAETDQPITDASIAPVDVAAVQTGCTAALEPGAPAPMAGYCSTQANVAATSVPSSPMGEWGTQLDANYAPSEMVVDPEGRSYLASCSAPEGGGWVECETLVALDTDGSVRWSYTFDSGVGGLFLDPAGTLHAESGVPRVLYTFDQAGNPTTQGTLPPNVSYGFVGSDANLYGTSIDYEGSANDALVKMTPEGVVLWSTPLACNDCIAGTALSPDDGLVATLIAPEGDGGLAGSMVHLDASGNLLWTRTLAGFTAEDIAVAADGSIRIALWEDYQQTASTLVLVSISAAGDVLWQTDLHQDPEQTGDDPLVVTNDGTTVLRSFTHLNAVDATGAILWSTPLTCPNCAYAAGADPHGGLVVLVDDIEGIDVATGKVLWSGITPPQEDSGTIYFGSTMTLGPPGVLFGSSFGGVVFEARGM
jgi:hypothetical protein